jgi:uncharacterized protein YndB with AHSA1/START domain
MTTISKTQISKDIENRRIIIEREFAAPVEQVWMAWTKSDLLDQWWAPKPWKAITKTMDFRPGGFWLYCMVGPENEAHWGRVDYQSVVKHESFQAMDSFCDENGIMNSDLPNTRWKNSFYKTETGSKIIIETSFSSEADIRKIIEMGFEAGFAAALINLDELLLDK